MMSNDIMVSVSCITYNHSSYIREALDGILMQVTNFRFEILVHDDCSTDGTANIIRDYEQAYPDLIKAIYQTENQYQKKDGIIGRIQRNRAKGKYYAVCEGDDFWTCPNKLQNQVDFLEKNPEYTLCCHDFEILDQETQEIKRALKRRRIFASNNFTFDLDNMIGWGAQPLTMMFRMPSNKLAELSNYKFSRDVHMYYHLLSLGKGYFINEVFGVYRHSTSGVHSKIGALSQKLMRFKIYDEMYHMHQDSYCSTRLFTASMSLSFYSLKEKNYISFWKYAIYAFSVFKHPINFLKVPRYGFIYALFYLVNMELIKLNNR